MSQENTLIRQQTNIIANDKQRPSVFGRKTGTLVLTKRRLIWVKGGLVDDIYHTLEELEKGLRERGGFEVLLASIKELNTGSFSLVPFFSVVYQTDAGSKSCSFCHSEAEDITPWFDAVNGEWIAQLEASSGKSSGERDLIMVDQSHDQDDRGTMQIADVVNTVSTRLKLNEPFAMYGRPENELLVANEHLLPRALLLISLGTKSGEKFSPQERRRITKYVEEGGRFLLTAFSPEDPPNELTEAFGVTFIKNVIEDEAHHAGRHKDHILVTDLADHPINEGVETIRFGKFGCYPLHIENPDAIILAASSEQADPPKAPVAALVPHGRGHVVVIGQTRLFQDDFIDEVDNRRWFENVLAFLTAKSPPQQEKPEVAPSPKYCTHCGMTLLDGARFCGNCGAKVT